MNELLIEILSEEIPARMQKDAELGFYQIFKAYLDKNQITYKDLKTYIGPRRITIHVTSLPDLLKGEISEFKGPKINAPDDAILGFCRSHNINRQDLSIIKIKDVEYYSYEQETKEQQLIELLKQELPNIIKEYTWPKSMIWGEYTTSWVRPIKNILCIFNGKVLDFKYGHITANNVTYGHRFLANHKLEVENFQDYQYQLTKNYVILSRQERLDIIKNSILQHCMNLSLQVKEDEDLLEEVAGLNEYPTILVGKIEDRFLQIPSEALVASMRNNQKYFSLFDINGNFAPYFLFATNILQNSEAKKDLIVDGNQRVLSARLADALYFYNQDISSSLYIMSAKLANVVFHTKIGSLLEKVQRVEKICQYIAPSDEKAQEAAKICKSDILSEMVGEFPELQGIMGYYYALSEKLDVNIASAIRDHYKPVGPSDSLPSGCAAILAIADKIDTICAIFCAGEKPSGSKDPYSLRRQTLGIIRIIIENNIKINLQALIEFSTNLIKHNSSEIRHQIYVFFIERLKVFFKEKYDSKLLITILDQETDLDLLKITKKLTAIQNFITTDSGLELISSCKRVCNILGEDNLGCSINKELFTTDFERNLFSITIEIKNKLQNLLDQDLYIEACEEISRLTPALEVFFANIMIKDPNLDPSIINNRLALMTHIRDIFFSVAEFNKL